MISYRPASGGDHSRCACQLRHGGELLIERHVTPIPVYRAAMRAILGISVHTGVQSSWKLRKKDY
jgi:hypothetical protein